VGKEGKEGWEHILIFGQLAFPDEAPEVELESQVGHEGHYKQLVSDLQKQNVPVSSDSHFLGSQAWEVCLESDEDEDPVGEMGEPVLLVEHPVAETREESEVRGPEISVVDERPFSKDPGSMQGFVVHEVFTIFHCLDH